MNTPMPIPNLAYNIQIARGDREKTIQFAIRYGCYTDSPVMTGKQFDNEKRKATKNKWRALSDPHTCENCRNRNGDPCKNEERIVTGRCMRWRRMIARPA